MNGVAIHLHEFRNFLSSYHHHHVPEVLGVFPVPWSSRWSWSLHLLGRPMFLRPFGLYRSACFGSLVVSILCTCCSHFSWYCFISFTMFCAPVFCLKHWFFSLSRFVILSKCLKIFICVASKTLFLSREKFYLLIYLFACYSKVVLGFGAISALLFSYIQAWKSSS